MHVHDQYLALFTVAIVSFWYFSIEEVCHNIDVMKMLLAFGTDV